MAAKHVRRRGRVADLDWLRAISRRINASRTLDDVLDVVYDGIRDDLGYDRVGIQLFDYEQGIFEERRGTDAEGHKMCPTDRTFFLAPDAPIWRYPGIAALLAGDEFYYTDDAVAATPPDLRFMLDGEPTQTMMAPVRVGERVAGLIAVDNLVSGRPFTPADAGPLLALANQVGTAVERAAAGAALRAREERLRALLEHGSDLVSIVDADGTIRYASPSHLSVLGHSPMDLHGRSLTYLMHPEDAAHGQAAIAAALQRAEVGNPVELRLCHTDGSWRTVEMILNNRLSDTALRGLIVTGRDVTVRTTMEATLRQREASFRLLFAHNPQPMWVYDMETLRFLEINEAAVAHYGYTRDEFLSMRITEIRPPEDLPRLLMQLEATRPALQNANQWRHQLKNGEIIDVDVSSHTLEFVGRPAALVIATDITARKRAEDALVHQALHDALTGLPNRTLLHDRLDHALHAAQRDDTTVALMLMDLDRFKEVNDTLGHHAGDVLLQEVAARLTGTLRATDTVARLGGDEFALLLPTTDAASAVHVAHMLRQTLSVPLILEDQSLTLAASIGLALAPSHGADAMTLLRRADVAMYVAKRAGGGYAVYDPAHDQHSPARLTLETELRRALADGELILHYQPIATLCSGRVERVEALVRWLHPQHGLIPPDQFIPLAEQTGLIVPLTRWVLEEALRQRRAWQRLGHNLGMAVNLSMRALHAPELSDTVARLLRRFKTEPGLLTLEITESALMIDPAQARAVLTRLSALGVHLAIDDFGTGYSSLGYLKQLPVDEVKIDKSFVQSMAETATKDSAIVRSIIELGHNLDLAVVAEGVEDQKVWACLQAAGCDVAQGYYLSRPLPAEELQRWLTLSPWGQVVA